MSKRPETLVVGQSGGCTHVINASLAGVIAEAQRHKQIARIWGMRHGIEGALKRDFIDLTQQDAKTLRAIARTPAAALGSCRRKVSDQELAQLTDFFDKNGVRWFIYIGGNDSADTTHRLARTAARLGRELQCVSVPKTIDNDLTHTDHTPGFGSAARFLASVTQDVGMETASMATYEPVKIIEVMGRNAGWLAAAAALAKRDEFDAPQFVWPPEIPFDEKRFLALTKAALKQVGYCLVVVAETIRTADGQPVGPHGRKEKDSFGHARITGAAQYLCELVRDRLKVRARWDKPGSIQRMASAYFSETDVREARSCGAHAVRTALWGGSDVMVVMRRAEERYHISYITAPLTEIANEEKLLPKEFFDRRNMLPTAAFREYALPLVGKGLPAHERLQNAECKAQK